LVQPCVYRDEGGRQHSLAEQVLQEIRDPERGRERVGRVGNAEVRGEEPLPYEPENAAQQNACCDQRRSASSARTSGAGRCRSGGAGGAHGAVARAAVGSTSARAWWPASSRSRCSSSKPWRDNMGTRLSTRSWGAPNG